MVSELPTGAPNEQSDREWLQRIRFGLRLLFWTILLSHLLSELTGFVLGLALWSFGGSRTHFEWVRLIHVLAGVPMLIGVWAITARGPAQRALAVSERLRRLLRVFACLGALAQAAQSLVPIVDSWMRSIYLWLSVSLVGALSVVLGLLYLAHLARRFGLGQLARSCRLALYVYGGSLLLYQGAIHLDIDTAWWKWSFFGSLFLGFCLWIWALALLRKFGARLTRAFEGRCIRCGYLLTGLPEPRCPECGQPFVIRTDH